MMEREFPLLVEKVGASPVLSSRQRTDMTALLQSIGGEFEPLLERDAEAARSALNFLNCAIWESVRKERTNILAAAARKGMLLAFRPFEDSNPALVNQVYALGDVLSALGV
jgi:hypothetical protein